MLLDEAGRPGGDSREPLLDAALGAALLSAKYLTEAGPRAATLQVHPV